MAKLQNKIKNVLDESRILILGAQVLLGFQYRSAFEARFDALPLSSKYLLLTALSLILIVLGLLISPASYHRIVNRGDDTEAFHRFTTAIIEIALLPFAFSLAINFYVATREVFPFPLAAAAGLISLGTPLYFWYGLELTHRSERFPRTDREGSPAHLEDALEQTKKEGDQPNRRTPLAEKIDHLLTETRVALPGAQALLGFQFVIFLTSPFQRLPSSLKYLHLASLSFITITTILLMTPAAYHRIVEKGENTEQFHRFASWILLASLTTLALGITGDFFVVVHHVTHSTPLAGALSLLMLFFFYGLWFGLTIYLKNRREEHRKGREILVASK